MKYNKLLILSFYFISSILNTYSQSKYSEIERFTNVVGYVYEEKVHTKVIDGLNYEIWLKDSVNKFVPHKYARTGSCFFIHKYADLYLVTAEHVSSFMSLNTLIVIGSKNNKPKIYKLKDIIQIDTCLIWTKHKHADVAVLQLDTKKIDEELSKCLIPLEMIEHNFRAPFRERQVTIFGYPLSLGIGKKISAITKTTNPSSGLIELKRFDKNILSTVFLLDDPSVSGFSGGPVFELPQAIGTGENKTFVTVYRIVGLVHGTISEKGAGFAAIVPSHYIKKTIENAPGINDTITFDYPDKSVWSKRIYKNGNPWTVLSNNNKKGIPQEMGTLKNGTGSLFIYNEDSKLNEKRVYKNGHLIELNQVK